MRQQLSCLNSSFAKTIQAWINVNTNRIINVYVHPTMTKVDITYVSNSKVGYRTFRTY